MWQRWVMRSCNAVVIMASPKTLAHSLKLRLVDDGTRALGELAENMEKQRTARGAERQLSQLVKNSQFGLH